MKTNLSTPGLPLRVTNTQYLPNGFGRPASTIYFLVDANGYTFHISDHKWRKKCLIEMNTHAFRSEDLANKYLDIYNHN